MERVLSGSYYEKDLKLLSECQEVEELVSPLQKNEIILGFE
jgi:hypothetical protein